MPIFNCQVNGIVRRQKTIMGENNSQPKLTADATLSEIVLNCSDAGRLLETIGLKPSAYKDQSLRSVCRQLNWSENEVLRWLKKKCVEDINVTEKVTTNQSLDEWVQYIKVEHLDKNIATIEIIKTDFDRFSHSHNYSYKWLSIIKKQLGNLEDTLRMYYRFEEKKFYPLLLRIEQSEGDLLYGSIKKIERGIEIIQKDQGRIRGFMKDIRVASNSFEVENTDAAKLGILIQKIEELFENINKQFDLEAKHLLPAVQELVETVY